MTTTTSPASALSNVLHLAGMPRNGVARLPRTLKLNLAGDGALNTTGSDHHRPAPVAPMVALDSTTTVSIPWHHDFIMARSFWKSGHAPKIRLPLPFTPHSRGRCVDR